MRKLSLFVLLAVLALGAWGCGGEDFEAGNRLIVESVTDENDNVGAVFNALEETDDSGRDGDPAVVDADGSQGDGFPDEGEELLQPIGDDRGKITVRNEARLGVDPGVDLEIFRVDITYLDANGNARSFAPTQSHTVTQVVSTDETVEFTVVVVPVDMKVNGLRPIFLTGTAEEVEAVRRWTLVVDVYARDFRNDDTVHAQGRMTVRFINPITEEVSGS